MKCAQCPFKAQDWSELRGHAITKHRWKPPLVESVLDAWDDARMTADRQLYDMEGYFAGAEREDS